eukprot:gnl/Chilomastix_caulleri/5695.p2 GENE.gnl/Chilomastix_caulleri/5695~~gnl/Chilomastix_caulleri/5695.p2  ORF type:complete len:108 (-),score=24.66 gnl/Chilomastix_caulleri/5695:58-381(-)
MLEVDTTNCQKTLSLIQQPQTLTTSNHPISVEGVSFVAVACVSPIECGTTDECANIVFSNCVLSNEFNVDVPVQSSSWVAAAITVPLVVCAIIVVSVGDLFHNKEEE